MSFTQREARGLIRKAVNRVPEGESIRHLNIMPMMDMMTILLVAFIFQMATSALELEAGTVELPRTAADAPMPEKAWTLIITPTAIVVQSKPIVSVNSNGDVDASEKEGGSLGIKIPRLTNFLASLRQEELRQMQRQGQDPAKAPPAELLILADRTTPYRLLIEVMFSAKQKEAGYKHFRLIVQKNFPVKPGK
ncbi:MAG TPA: biopolymer transporter ExbD [Kofleriaceae bacterium]|jgi:biopolymer transport protein ExbD|nr:biopolymer transporter ExbD [Kofleriaceae bacterium]